MSINDVCRLCLAADNLSWIFDEKNESENIKMKDIVYLATGIEVRVKDVISQQICDNCSQFTYKMFQFRSQCMKSEKYLKEQCKKYFKNRKSDIPNTQGAIRSELKQISNEPRKPTCRIPIHPTVTHLAKTYPQIKLPVFCLKSHIAPVVVMEMDEVESYFKKRNLDINVYVKSALRSTRKIKKIERLQEINSNIDQKTVIGTHQLQNNSIIKSNKYTTVVESTNIKRCLKKHINMKTKRKLGMIDLIRKRQINNSSANGVAKTRISVESNSIKQRPKRNSNISEDVKIFLSSSNKFNRKRKLSKIITESNTKRSRFEALLDTSNRPEHSLNMNGLSESFSTDTKDLLNLIPKGTTHSLNRNNSESLSYIDKSVPLHICNICNSVQYTTKHLRKHRIEHLRCQFCKVRFRNLWKKRYHIENLCIIKKAMTNMPDIELERIEDDLETRRKYPDAFVNFPPFETENIIDLTDCDTNVNLLQHDVTQKFRTILNNLMSSSSRPLYSARAKSTITDIYNMPADHLDIIEILSDEDEPSKTSRENHTKDSIPTESTNHSSIWQGNVQNCSLASPKITVKNNCFLNNIDLMDSDLNIMKRLLTLSQPIRAFSQTHTQTCLPLNKDIIILDGNIILKDLKEHVWAYNIPVIIRFGKLNVSYEYSTNPKQHSKLCFWNDLIPIDIKQSGDQSYPKISDEISNSLDKIPLRKNSSPLTPLSINENSTESTVKDQNHPKISDKISNSSATNPLHTDSSSPAPLSMNGNSTESTMKDRNYPKISDEISNSLDTIPLHTDSNYLTLLSLNENSIGSRMKNQNNLKVSDEISNSLATTSLHTDSSSPAPLSMSENSTESTIPLHTDSSSLTPLSTNENSIESTMKNQNHPKMSDKISISSATTPLYTDSSSLTPLSMNENSTESTMKDRNYPKISDEISNSLDTIPLHTDFSSPAPLSMNENSIEATMKDRNYPKMSDQISNSLDTIPLHTGSSSPAPLSMKEISIESTMKDQNHPKISDEISNSSATTPLHTDSSSPAPLSRNKNSTESIMKDRNYPKISDEISNFLDTTALHTDSSYLTPLSLNENSIGSTMKDQNNPKISDEISNSLATTPLHTGSSSPAPLSMNENSTESTMKDRNYPKISDEISNSLDTIPLHTDSSSLTPLSINENSIESTMKYQNHPKISDKVSNFSAATSLYTDSSSSAPLSMNENSTESTMKDPNYSKMSDEISNFLDTISLHTDSSSLTPLSMNENSTESTMKDQNYPKISDDTIPLCTDSSSLTPLGANENSTESTMKDHNYSEISEEISNSLHIIPLHTDSSSLTPLSINENSTESKMKDQNYPQISDEMSNSLDTTPLPTDSNSPVPLSINENTTESTMKDQNYPNTSDEISKSLDAVPLRTDSSYLAPLSMNENSTESTMKYQNEPKISEEVSNSLDTIPLHTDSSSFTQLSKNENTSESTMKSSLQLQSDAKAPPVGQTNASPILNLLSGNTNLEDEAATPIDEEI